jgi:hypothetical protein
MYLVASVELGGELGRIKKVRGVPMGALSKMYGVVWYVSGM